MDLNPKTCGRCRYSTPCYETGSTACVDDLVLEWVDGRRVCVAKRFAPLLVFEGQQGCRSFERRQGR